MQDTKPTEHNFTDATVIYGRDRFVPSHCGCDQRTINENIFIIILLSSSFDGVGLVSMRLVSLLWRHLIWYCSTTLWPLEGQWIVMKTSLFNWMQQHSEVKTIQHFRIFSVSSFRMDSGWSLYFENVDGKREDAMRFAMTLTWLI